MDKFTRQLNLVALLEQAGTDLTLAEIRDRLRDEAYPQGDPESARRAFERDKADLLRMGVPLTATRKGDDPSGTVYGIRTTRSELADPGFTPEELAALRFAATAMALRSEDSTTLDDARDGLRKYGGLGDAEPTRTLAELSLDQNLTTVFTAILEERAVGFSYSGEVRRVLPLQVASRAGRWYLRCVQVGDGESRTYRLDRIEGSVLPLEESEAGEGTGERIDRPEGTVGDSLRFRPWEFGVGEPVRTLVRLDRAAASVARAGDPGLEVHEEDDHGVVVDLSVRNPPGLWPWLLGFLERAELLEPTSMREAYTGILAEMAQDPDAGTGATT